MVGFDFARTLVGLLIVFYKRRQVHRFSFRLPPLILHTPSLPILRDKIQAFSFPRRCQLLDPLDQPLILIHRLLSCLTLMNHPVTLISMPNRDLVHQQRQVLFLHVLLHQLVNHLLV